MNEVRIGVVGIPGKWSTEAIADALESRTGFRLVVDMAEVRADLASGSLWFGDIDLCGLDGLVVKKISEEYSPHTLDRVELLRLAENRGVRVFSRTEVIVRMIDRLACTMTLRNGGVPMPETTVTESKAEALDTVRRYRSAVFKPLFSTKARGMCVLESDSDEGDLLARIDQFSTENPMMYIQKRVELPGRDFGMVFLGGEYLGSYARIAEGDSWNTTIHSGGRYAEHQPPGSTIELARHAQSLFGMDFTTVDVADTPDGPVIFEVSAFGGFRGAREGIGIDAASRYADYILASLEGQPGTDR